MQAVVLCDGVPGALVLGGADTRVDGADETSHGSITSVPFAHASACPGRVLASGVQDGRSPLGLARTDPSGRPGELPVVGVAAPARLQVGWPGQGSLLDLTGRGLPEVEVVAAPAA